MTSRGNAKKETSKSKKAAFNRMALLAQAVKETSKSKKAVFNKMALHSYWNINSAGVFSMRYGKKKENIWSASEVQNAGSATTDNASQSEPNADSGSTSNGTASNVSTGKGSDNSASDQEKGIKSYKIGPFEFTTKRALQSVARS